MAESDFEYKTIEIEKKTARVQVLEELQAIETVIIMRK